MKPEEVLAVVVSYDGRGKTRRSVEALLGQVGHIHIVDNGSMPESLVILESLERERNVTVERLGENRGVGYALNIGVQRARQMGFPWLLTMDQDSIVDSGLTQAYQAAIQRTSTPVCLAPTLRKRDVLPSAPDEAIGYAITSGNLVHVSVFARIGLYDEGFFIDCIDFDFCLRLRREGHVIYRVHGATMHHELGAPVDIPTWLKKYYARHSPLRRYYMYRNFMYMLERYFRTFPTFILKLAFAQLALTVLIGVLDPHPLQSYKAIKEGIADYFARRDGPYIGSGE